MQQPHEKTTIGDRLSTGALNAGLWGGITAAGSLIVNGGFKLFSKSPHRMFGKMDWIITSTTAAVAGAYSFFTANKDRENTIKNALDAVNDPNNPASKEEKQRQTEKIIEDSMNGKMPIETTASDTKFQNMVATSRAQAAAAGKGV